MADNEEAFYATVTLEFVWNTHCLCRFRSLMLQKFYQALMSMETTLSSWKNTRWLLNTCFRVTETVDLCSCVQCTNAILLTHLHMIKAHCNRSTSNTTQKFVTQTKQRKKRRNNFQYQRMSRNATSETRLQKCHCESWRPPRRQHHHIQGTQEKPNLRPCDCGV